MSKTLNLLWLLLSLPCIGSAQIDISSNSISSDEISTSWEVQTPVIAETTDTMVVAFKHYPCGWEGDGFLMQEKQCRDSIGIDRVLITRFYFYSPELERRVYLDLVHKEYPNGNSNRHMNYNPLIFEIDGSSFEGYGDQIVIDPNGRVVSDSTSTDN